ncbi:ribosomal RNA-processing protein 8 [Arapaima gigas]
MTACIPQSAMFAQEQDWGDGPQEEALGRAVGHGGPRSRSSKTAPKICSRKKSLLRTLQTLGSVPSWTQDTPAEDSEDSDLQVAPKHRKKRAKKRKNPTGADGDAAGQASQDGVQKEAGIAGSKLSKKKERKAQKGGTIQVKKQKPVRDSEHKDSEPAVKKTKEGEVEEHLSRQQWKNKMKNKRRCKNKYRQNEKQASGEPKGDTGSRETISVEPNEGPIQVQNKKNKIKQPKQLDKEAQHKMPKKENKNTEPGVNSNSHSQDRTNRSKMKVEDQPTCKGLRPEENILESREIDAGLTERKRHEMRKQRRAKVERLRNMLLSKTSESMGAPMEEDKGNDHIGKQEEAKEEVAVTDRSAALRARMEQRLEAARFRYINEQLYSSSSKEAVHMFKQDPEAFDIYHRGFTAQVQHWPTNPLDAIIAYIKRKPASLVVADFGCGDCKIARSVKNKVHSFDLAPICDLVTVCDMAKVPLRNASVDIAVFCLSLMGTNLVDFLAEANRVLVMGGVLKIAEVASRFENVRSFLSALANLGFKCVSKDTENSHFYNFDFVKTVNTPEKVRKVGLELKPCVYKKR